MKTLRFLSLFSGIEAASVAWLPLGWTCAGVAEIEPFPCAVLRHRYPDVPNLGDITKITREHVEALGPIDLVVLGFPCQDLSVAGLRKGLTNADGTLTRSGLFFTAMQVIEWAGPRWVVGENVPGLFSSNGGRDFASVAGELAGCSLRVPEEGWRNSGVALGPKGLVEWAVLDAQYFGVPQRRRRIFFVRDSGDWSGRPPVLLIEQSLRGDSPPRRETGQRVTGTPRVGSPLSSTGEISHCLNAGGMGRIDYETETMITHSLRGEGFDASEDGTGRGTPPVPVALRGHSDYGDGLPSLRANGGDCAGGSEAWEERAGPIDTDGSTQAVAVAFNMHKSGNDGSSLGISEERTDCLRAFDKSPFAVQPIGSAVRRLTPLECSRLQGFSDDYLDITYRGKPAADGVKYKALGNTFAVPVVSWIGKRIQAVESLKTA